MVHIFPREREAKRHALLAAVEAVREPLLAGAAAAEAQATLPATTVQALDDAGLLALQLPAVLGGAEADLVTQLEVLAAVSYIDTAAGWCTLIGAAAIAGLGAFLPDKAVAEVFANSQIPRAAGAFMPRGEAFLSTGLSGQCSLGLCQWYPPCPMGFGYGAGGREWLHSTHAASRCHASGGSTDP